MISHTQVRQPALSRLESLLARPDEQRIREYKYRCAQALVFGLPVIALQYFGPRLGGPESPRWIAILQALLSGWVIYIGAAGMLFEGLILIARCGIGGDLIVGGAAISTYLLSLIGGVLPIVFTGHLGAAPMLFHVAVALIACWSGYRWWQWTRRAATSER